MITVQLKPLLNRDQENIGIYFTNQSTLNTIVRKIPGIKWSDSQKCWYLSLSRENYKKIVDTLAGKAGLDTSVLLQYLEKRKKIIAVAPLPAWSKKKFSPPVLPSSPVWRLGEENLLALRKFMEELKLRCYSASTITTYRTQFLQLLLQLNNRPVHALTTDELRRYFVYCFEKL